MLTIEDVAARLSESLDTSLNLEMTNPSPLILIPADRLREATMKLKNDPELEFDSLCCLTGIERNGSFEVVITLYSGKLGLTTNLKVTATADDPVVPTVSDIWPAAGWHEREAFDMFGIHFEGLKDHRRILCPDDWEGFPLRKNYQPPLFYHDIPVTVNVPGAVPIPLTRKEN